MLELSKEYVSNTGDKFVLVKVLNSRRCVVKFLDEFEYEKEVDVKSAIKGEIRNPYHKSVIGIGYLGVGKYNSKSMGRKIYNVWVGIIERSYSEKWKKKYPTYKNVIVCDEWLNFQNFAKWYDNNYPHHIQGIKFEVDKDLKQENVENKIYSPETCIIVPKRINGFMVNKQSSNTSGYIGVRKLKGKNKWSASSVNQIKKSPRNLGVFNTLEEALACYEKDRCDKAEKLRAWVRELNYLDEDTIQLIK